MASISANNIINMSRIQNKYVFVFIMEMKIYSNNNITFSVVIFCLIHVIILPQNLIMKMERTKSNQYLNCGFNCMGCALKVFGSCYIVIEWNTYFMLQLYWPSFLPFQCKILPQWENEFPINTVRQSPPWGWIYKLICNSHKVRHIPSQSIETENTAVTMK